MATPSRVGSLPRLAGLPVSRGEWLYVGMLVLSLVVTLLAGRRFQGAGMWYAQGAFTGVAVVVGLLVRERFRWADTPAAQGYRLAWRILRGNTLTNDRL